MDSRRYVGDCSHIDLLAIQDVYVEDYKIVIKQRESARLTYLHRSPQIMYRSNLIKYLKHYCAQKRISYSCLHLAVYILDIFMDNHSIVSNRLFLVANVCLLIAAKLEETTAIVPKFEELNFSSKQQYAVSDYKTLELLILNHFDWFFAHPTSAHYVHYYMQTVLNYEDVANDTRNYEEIMLDVNDYVRLYLDRVIEDVHYVHMYLPSRLAAAVLCVSRMRAGLRSWTYELQLLTEYSRDQLEDPVVNLLTAAPIACSTCSRSHPL